MDDRAQIRFQNMLRFLSDLDRNWLYMTEWVADSKRRRENAQMKSKEIHRQVLAEFMVWWTVY